MQTEAEKYLISIVKKILSVVNYHLKTINLGAAKSTVVENSLLVCATKSEINIFHCDRADIQDTAVDKLYVKNNYLCPLEDMSVIPSETYDLAFANFVLEHINDPTKAALEMGRIMKPGGELVLSMSNPMAPEFIFAKLTPTWFHQLFRQVDQDEAYPVVYSYKSVRNFVKIMSKAGWLLVEEKRFPAIYSYLYRFPVFNLLAKIYDEILTIFQIKALKGHVVLHFNKPVKNN